MHDPVEKNLKHKTDVLSWADIPWEACDLNFRAPSVHHLVMSPARAYSRFALAAAFGTIISILVGHFIMPEVTSRNPIEAWTVAAIVVVLVGGGFYRPLPHRVPRQRRGFIAICVGGSVLAFYIGLCLAHPQGVFVAGVVLLLGLALPSCLLIADQMTTQALFWVSADPGVDRNTMVALRNAWCGRFMTEHSEVLASRNVSPQVIRSLKKYWLHHLAVALSFGVGGVAGLIAASQLNLLRVGFVIIGLSTVLLVLLGLSTHARTKGIEGLFPFIMGHWFDFQKDTIEPPWMLQSPSGSQLSRVILSHAAVIVLACSFMLLGLSDLSWGTRTIADLIHASGVEIGLIAIASTVIAPLWMLLICFIVAGPTIATVHQASEEACDDQG